jgi:hypothetical protein
LHSRPLVPLTLQRCRDHWQNSDLGFDETDFTRIRHYGLK